MTTERSRPIAIVMAEDDPQARMLAVEALKDSSLANRLHCVKDGKELLDYLRRQGLFADPTSAPRPDLILLDLNMPRVDGRAALRQIKADPALRQIPVVVLTTSRVEEDIRGCYDLGANSFIVKPDTFDALVAVMRGLERYWFGIVELPSSALGGDV